MLQMNAMDEEQRTEENMENNKMIAMDVDVVLENTGPCGRFQCALQFMFMLLVGTIGYYQVSNYFLGNDPSWTCVSKNSSSFCEQHFGKVITSDSKNFYKRCHLNQSEWNYTKPKKYSFVTEFDLVCEKTWMAAVTSGAFYIGGLFGSLPAGIIADKYGRKLVMIIAQILLIASSIGCSLVSTHWQLAGLRVILGGSQMVCYSIGFVNLSEFIAPSYRTVSGVMYQLSFCFSELLITAFAFFEREWRHLQLYASFACMIPLILFFFYPNSPRWLLSVGKTKEATNVLQRMAKYNKHPQKGIALNNCAAETNPNGYTYFDLCKHFRVFLISSLLAFLWTIVALLYFAIALESSNLGGNMYQAFALTAFADFPSYFVTWYACNKFGRKKSVLGGIVGAGIFIGCCALVPQSYESKYIINITLAMCAKFLTNFAFSSIFVWTFEVFPTVIRSQGMSYCIAWERIGAFGAPFLISLLRSVNYILPYIVLLVTSLFCGLTGLVLPETNGLPTKESFDDFLENRTRSDIVEECTMSHTNKGLDLEKETTSS